MTQLMKLSGPRALTGDLEETNPLVFDDIALGMLFWAQVVKRFPDLTFADIKKIRMMKKDVTLGAKWYERAWDGLTDTVGDISNWIADKSGDATRLIFLEESEGGETAVGGIIDAVAAYYTQGGSATFKDMQEGENGNMLDQFLGFFKGSGEGVRNEIQKAGIDPPATTLDLEPKHFLWIGGGILGTILIIILASRAFAK